MKYETISFRLVDSLKIELANWVLKWKEYNLNAVVDVQILKFQDKIRVIIAKNIFDWFLIEFVLLLFEIY